MHAFLSVINSSSTDYNAVVCDFNVFFDKYSIGSRFPVSIIK